MAVERRRSSRLVTHWPDRTADPDLQTPSRNFITEQTMLVSLAEVRPSCVLHQRYCFTNALPPSSHLLLTPHSFFLSPCPPSCFPSLRIKVMPSGCAIHWSLVPAASTGGKHRPHRSVRWLSIRMEGWRGG